MLLLFNSSVSLSLLFGKEHSPSSKISHALLFLNCLDYKGINQTDKSILKGGLIPTLWAATKLKNPTIMLEALKDLPMVQMRKLYWARKEFMSLKIKTLKRKRTMKWVLLRTYRREMHTGLALAHCTVKALWFEETWVAGIITGRIKFNSTVISVCNKIIMIS